MSDAVVVDFSMGNVGSIVNMGRAAGGILSVSNSERDIATARRLILPGVGAFDHGMSNLQKSGLVPVLSEAALHRRVPVLGICLGMQLLCRRSEEGALPGLQWLAADTVRFRNDGMQLRIPHMGWNNVQPALQDPLLCDLPPNPRFYFVHSFHVRCDDESDVIAWTEYGYSFASVVRHSNVMGVQFHPEKSHKFGLALMRSFLASS